MLKPQPPTPEDPKPTTKPNKRSPTLGKCYARKYALKGIETHGAFVFPICPALQELWDQDPPEKGIRLDAMTGPSDLDCVGRIVMVCYYLSLFVPSFGSLALFAHRTNLLKNCLDLIRIDLRSLPKRLEKDYPQTSEKCRQLVEELEAAERWYALWRPTHLFLLPRCFTKIAGEGISVRPRFLNIGTGSVDKVGPLPGFEGVPFPPNKPLPEVHCAPGDFLAWQRTEVQVSATASKMAALSKGLPRVDARLTAYLVNYYPAGAIVAARNLREELRAVAESLGARMPTGRAAEEGDEEDAGREDSNMAEVKNYAMRVAEPHDGQEPLYEAQEANDGSMGAGALQVVKAMETDNRTKLLQQKALDISKWVAQNSERKEILEGCVGAFSRVQDAYERALSGAVVRARRMSWLQNRGNRPGKRWRWIHLFGWEVAALDKSNVDSDGLVTVPQGTGPMGFWAESLPFDPLGWVVYHYGHYVLHGEGPHDADSIPQEPTTKEQVLMCKSVLVAVIWDRAPERCSVERLTPGGPLDWPERMWLAVSLHEATPLNEDDYKKKTDRILHAWEDVKREIDELLRDNEQARGALGKPGERKEQAGLKEQPSSMVQTEVKLKGWKPPKNYTGAKSTGVPRSTLEGWEQKDAQPGGTLEGKVKKDPRTGEKYYPNGWLNKRKRNYEPRKRSP